jgi:hypothetical protein
MNKLFFSLKLAVTLILVLFFVLADAGLAAPDLFLELIIVDEHSYGVPLKAGDTIHIITEVENIGDQKSDNFTVDYYAGDYLIGHSDHAGLEAGVEDIFFSTACKFPEDIVPGIYCICAIINCSNDINPGNNMACYDTGGHCIPVQIIQIYPNLVIQSVDATDGIYRPGDQIIVSVAIENMGDRSSDSYSVDYYASTDTTITDSDYHIGGVYRGILKPGEVDTFETTCNFPDNIPVGRYFIGIILTYSKNGDSTSIEAYDIAVWVGSAADLAVQTVEAADDTYRPGDQIKVDVTIKNTGEASSEDYAVDYYASKDTIITTGDYRIGHEARGGLGPGEADIFQTTCELPGDIPEGRYFVGIIVTCSNDDNSLNNKGYDNAMVALIPLVGCSEDCVVILHASAQQTKIGQDFIWEFSDVPVSDGRDGMFTIRAQGDYAWPPSNELAWRIDEIAHNRETPGRNTWEERRMISGADLVSITSDRSVTISIYLSYNVMVLEDSWVDVTLTYTRAPELRRYYVDAGAAPEGDGRNWANAFKYLQDALTAPSCTCEIREILVAQGIYRPDQGVGVIAGDRTATFHLKDCFTIKGGYAGLSEPDPNARDIELYKTILSGDLSGNDVDVNGAFELLAEPTHSENSYHVVTVSNVNELAILDGLTITGGNANGSGINGWGGGMRNESASPTITNCRFIWNSADYGGGMQNHNSSPQFNNCKFGGNWASINGGAMSNYESIPILVDCVFTDNSANEDGGSMYNSSSRPNVSYCTFNDGWTVNGSGGGVYNRDSTLRMECCTFSSNVANTDGGGMYNLESNSFVLNCIFSGNWAKSNGGGLYNQSSRPEVTNCTIIGNRATLSGGSTYSDSLSRQTLTNCILWANTPDQIYGSDTVLYSDVQDGRTGECNINADPCFVRLGYWELNGTPNNPSDDFWVDGDYHLLVDSPCIDCGNNNHILGSSIDCDGHPRIINNVVDLGAYEFVVPDSLSEALDTTLSFTSGGSATWFYQTTTSYYDGDAAQSGDILSDQRSWMQTTVDGLRTISFYWKVSSEARYDFLEFYIDGSCQDRISGSVDWQKKNYEITPGLHMLEWRYVKDTSKSSGSDCGWVDWVHLVHR